MGRHQKGRDRVVRNAAYLIDRRGKVVGTYYKTHPCQFYTPGAELPVFETDFGTVGIVICGHPIQFRRPELYGPLME